MNHFKAFIIIPVTLAIVVVSVLTFYSWYLGQIIYQSTFQTKAGMDFWATWTLDNNIFLASFFLAFLSSIIMLPQRSTLISFMSAISQSGPIVRRLELRTGILWRLTEFGGFFLFYVASGGYAVTGQNVAFLLFLSQRGSISINSDQLSQLYALPFHPDISSDTIISLVPAMEAYQLFLGFAATFLVITAARIFLNMFTDMLSKRRDGYVIISKALFAVSLVIVVEILSVPLWTVNAGTYLSFIGLIVGLIVSLIGAFVFLVMRLRKGGVRQRLRSKIAQLEQDLTRLQGELQSVRTEYESGDISLDNYRRRVSLLMEDQTHISSELRRLKLERLIPFTGSPRNFALLSIILLGMVLVAPVAQTFLYEIPMNGEQYTEWKFNYETAKEIAITNWAAGLDGMQTKSIDDLTSNATPESEVEFLSTVRQWDQQASYLRMKNQIGTNWMQLADSDIVYLKDHEYWIAPLTFDYATTSTSFIAQHIVYTHTEGMVVLDAYSGDIVEGNALVALFNRSDPINTYYGEGRGFREVAFVNVPGYDEVGSDVFRGSPDYTLSEFESTFYMFTLGLEAWSFMGNDMDMLVERDVISRVQSILLQGLTVDSDPYIVADPSGNIYYAVSVYIDYSLATGYAHENYMRFLGVVLVDIENGGLHFYSSPIANSDFFIDSTYMSYYDWNVTPDWLQSQMKWPEDLYERQLDIAYIYHVNKAETWLSGSEFHQSPAGSDTRYIIGRFEGQDRFIAMHNAEFFESQGRNLAGIYIMGSGSIDFGNLTFYSAGEGADAGYSTLLGPNAAVQAFETDDAVRTQLQLWGDHRYGNRLLYHLGGDLFFVIPVFLVVETSTEGVIQKLGGVGLVDAKTGERVSLGANVVEAYYRMFGLLNQTVIEEGKVGIESAVLSPTTVESGDYSNLVLMLRNNDVVAHNLSLDITVAAGNFSVIWHNQQVTPTFNPSNTTFTLDIGALGPGDLYGTTPQISAILPAGIVSAQYLVEITLRTEEGIVDSMTLILTVT